MNSKHLFLLSFLLVASMAQAQNYPSKTVRLIVPFAAGGPTDKVSRDSAEALR